jgi:hypothetical protein
MKKERVEADEYVKRCEAYTVSVKASIESAKSYNNFVLLIGYGSFFAMWKFLEEDLSRGQRLWSAAFMSTSLVIFVLWEIGRMYWGGIQAMRMSILARRWMELGPMIVWFIAFTAALIAAMVAIVIMFSTFAQSLVDLYRVSETK